MSITPTEQVKAARAFRERWQVAEGNEDRESHSFWIELFQQVLGIEFPTKLLDFERRVRGKKIDVFYEDQGILIENKSRGVGLDKLEQRGKNRDGSPRMVTPYEQAKWYAEDLPVLRGKVDMAGTVRSRLARKRLVSCEYDELSEDNLLNRILKTTAMLLLHHGDVSPEHRDELKKRMLFFTTVGEVEPGGIRWSSIRFTRNNQSYRMLLSVCQLVIDGMLLTDERGEMRLMTYIKPQYMERLYEKFILEYYRKECGLASASSPQIKWALDDGLGTMLPTMQSDIVLSRGNTVLIIDAKYYTHTLQENWDAHTIHSGNLYQIFTYVKNKEAELAGAPHEVSGMLLYAKTDEETQPDGAYQMSGNRISVRTLDLNLPFDQIAAQLDTIAEEHFAKEAMAV